MTHPLWVIEYWSACGYYDSKATILKTNDGCNNVGLGADEGGTFTDWNQAVDEYFWHQQPDISKATNISKWFNIPDERGFPKLNFLLPGIGSFFERKDPTREPRKLFWFLVSCFAFAKIARAVSISWVIAAHCSALLFWLFLSLKTLSR